MKHKNFWFLILLIVAIALIFGFVIERPYTFCGSVIDPAVEAPDFKLISNQGNEYHLKSRNGQFILMFFGYTYCPDVCPTTLYEMKEIKERLGDKAEKVDFVFVTVDPERDTKEQLKKYLESFDNSFFGLTGEEKDLEPVWKNYGVYREIQPQPNTSRYLVDHTSRLYLINSDNELFMTYLYETPMDDIVSDLNYLIRKGS